MTLPPSPLETYWKPNAAAFLKIHVNEATQQWEFDIFLAGNKAVRLIPRSILHLGFSYDSLQNSATWYNIIDVTEEWRRPNARELGAYMYLLDSTPKDELKELDNLCVLTIQASGVVVLLLCKGYDLVELPPEGVP